MSINQIEDIKGPCLLFRFGKYIVAAGLKFYVFSISGTLLYCRSDIKHAFKLLYLAKNRLLIDGGQNKYRLISLIDGTDIWCTPQPAHELSARRFALSTSGKYAYDFHIKSENYYLIKLNIENATIEKYLIDEKLRTTNDIFCDESDCPCLLQSHYSYVDDRRFSENGIICPSGTMSYKSSVYNWKNRWNFDGKTISYGFLNCIDLILTNDLYLYDQRTGELDYLLRNEKKWAPSALMPSAFSIFGDNQFLVLSYPSECANVIIDIRRKKVIAKYASQYGQGCIVGDEFWVSSDLGIQRKRFPSLEEIPKKKSVMWHSARKEFL